MSLTVKTCEKVIERALGGTPDTFTAIDLINQASEALVSSYEWSFLKGGSVDVSFVADQDYATLPADFGHELATERKDGFSTGFAWTSKDHLAELRSHDPRTRLHFWGAIVWEQDAATGTLTHDGAAPADAETVTVNGKVYTFKTTIGTTDGHVVRGADGETSADNLVAAINLSGTAGTTYGADTTLHETVSARRATSLTITLEAKTGGEAGNAYTLAETVDSSPAEWTGTTFTGGGGPPKARIALYPTPSTAEVAGLKLFYARTLGTATSDSYEIPVVPYCHTLYLEILRAIAQGYEEHDLGTASMRLTMVFDGPLFENAKRRDARTQSTYGVLAGGVTQRMRGYGSRYDNTIPDPA
jgi:hypothetical protein